MSKTLFGQFTVALEREEADDFLSSGLDPFRRRSLPETKDDDGTER